LKNIQPSVSIHKRVTESLLGGFRGTSCSKGSTEHYGFVRTLNLAGVPLSGLIDCFAVNVFR